ncbi:MAG: hypothetical protein R3324_20825 [Halobacteriales archaeon]|nr:hypothetical protein [Halobacteriales archaeon]
MDAPGVEAIEEGGRLALHGAVTSGSFESRLRRVENPTQAPRFARRVSP